MTTQDDPHSLLPEVSEERIATMERNVFSHISTERTGTRRRRRRWWIAGGAAAAIVAVAAVIAPAVGASLSGTATNLSADSVALEPVQLAPGSAGGSGAESITEESAAYDAASGTARETISNGSASIVVEDVRDAADAVAAAAEARGGYVESLSIGSTGVMPADSGMVIDPGYPGAGDGWISVRVPADQLAAAIADLDEIGEVTSSTVSSTDVTDQAVDLRARIAAAETSVARLTELMAQAQSTADLLAAETALQERQAALDADRQQLELLEGQVALASLSVQLTPHSEPVEADPAGFGDGVAAGWNGLVATLNGIVIALGFLLPWLAVLAVAGAIVWGIVRLVRRARRRSTRSPGTRAGIPTDTP